MEQVGKTFRDTRVRVDGQVFRDCLFERAIFEYGGGAVLFSGCTFDGCSWKLTGDLMRGLETLRHYSHLSGPRTVKDLVDSISRFLRRKLPTDDLTIH